MQDERNAARVVASILAHAGVDVDPAAVDRMAAYCDEVPADASGMNDGRSLADRLQRVCDDSGCAMTIWFAAGKIRLEPSDPLANRCVR